MNEIWGTKSYTQPANSGTGRSPLVKMVYYHRGELFDRIIKEPIIAFVLDGKIELYSKIKLSQIIDRGRLFLIPQKFCARFRCLENTRLVYCHIREDIQFFNKLKFNTLRNAVSYKQINIEYCPIPTLEVGQPINLFFTCLLASLEDGLNCEYYFEIKLNELFILMNTYCSDNSLSMLFYPLINEDFPFIRQIFENKNKVFSVNEMASIVRFSPLDFRKHFKRIFGELPSDWMNRERTKLILHKLALPDKSLNQISEECGFLSLSCFNMFCKKYLNDTPLK
jgi:AraC-like DNA-binding protein